MKQAEIAAKVFESLDSRPLADVGGGAVGVPVADLAGLALVPWFCDPSVQWAVRLTPAATGFNKSPLGRIRGCHIAVSPEGALLIGIPGDGIEPSTYALRPLAAALGAVLEPGMRLELGTANLGVVKRDWEVKAETGTNHGNQHYTGNIDAARVWCVDQTSPAMGNTTLAAALHCGRMVDQDGPWEVADRAEAYAVVLAWLGSRQANVNPAAVARFIKLEGGAFRNSDPGMTRKLCGLGLAFFRRRLAGGPFHWAEEGPAIYPVEELNRVAETVVGRG